MFLIAHCHSFLRRLLLSALLDQCLAVYNLASLLFHNTFVYLMTSHYSWIGSMNAFLILSGGLFFGRLYDKGYLWVHFFFWLLAAIFTCYIYP